MDIQGTNAVDHHCRRRTYFGLCVLEHPNADNLLPRHLAYLWLQSAAPLVYTADGTGFRGFAPPIRRLPNTNLLAQCSAYIGFEQSTARAWQA